MLTLKYVKSVAVVIAGAASQGAGPLERALHDALRLPASTASMITPPLRAFSDVLESNDLPPLAFRGFQVAEPPRFSQGPIHLPEFVQTVVDTIGSTPLLLPDLPRLGFLNPAEWSTNEMQNLVDSQPLRLPFRRPFAPPYQRAVMRVDSERAPTFSSTMKLDLSTRSESSRQRAQEEELLTPAQYEAFLRYIDSLTIDARG